MRSSLVVAMLVAASCGATACGDDGSVTADAPAIDAPPIKDPCSTCARDELCVQRFDGTCNATVACVATALRCSPNTCSAECEAALCPRPYQCANRAPCGSESPAAFTCYGP